MVVLGTKTLNKLSGTIAHTTIAAANTTALIINRSPYQPYYNLEGLGKMSGVNFCAALMLPLIFSLPLHSTTLVTMLER
jgi:hypothetical protein